jgi:hypothetical protein
MRDRFMERGFVSRYGMDDEIAREIGKSSPHQLLCCGVSPDECRREILSKRIIRQLFSEPTI